MTSDVNAVQESIKLALDAAEAAADVTAEYNKLKDENKKLIGNVSSVYKNARLIAGISVVAVIGTLGLSLVMHFNSVGSLRVLGDTNRQALVVFAENVDDMNTSAESLRETLDRQDELLVLTKQLTQEVVSLRTESEKPVLALGESVKTSFEQLTKANNALDKKISIEVAALTKKLTSNQDASTKKILSSTSTVTSQTQKGSAVVTKTNKALQDIISMQAKTVQQIGNLIRENERLLGAIENNNRQIKYP
jgi:hypothetical protein